VVPGRGTTPPAFHIGLSPAGQPSG